MENLVKYQIIDNHSSQSFLNVINTALKNEHFGNKVEISLRDYNYLYTDSTNFGIKKLLKNSSWKYLFLINPDIELLYEAKGFFFDKIINSMNEYGADIAGIKLLYTENGPIEFAGGEGNAHRGYKMPLEAFNKATPSEWSTGAFMCLRRSVIESVGLLDSTLNHWISDQEYCRRAGFMGWSTWYLPFKAIHRQGSGAGFGDNHKLVFEDLAPGIEPNTVSLNLEQIISLAKKNVGEHIIEKKSNQFT